MGFIDRAFGCFDRDANVARRKRTPLVFKPILAWIIRIQRKLIHHGAFRVRYGMRPPHRIVKADGHTGRTDESCAIGVVDARDCEVLLPKARDAVPRVVRVCEQ